MSELQSFSEQIFSSQKFNPSFSLEFFADPNQQQQGYPMQQPGYNPHQQQAYYPPPQTGFAPHQQQAYYPPPQQNPYQQPSQPLNMSQGAAYQDPEDLEAKGFEFTDQSIRKAFIRKVFSILTVRSDTREITHEFLISKNYSIDNLIPGATFSHFRTRLLVCVRGEHESMGF